MNKNQAKSIAIKKIKKEKKSAATGNILNVSVREVISHLVASKSLEKYASLEPSLKESVIPYLLPSFLKGTQVVQIRLPLIAYKVTVSSGVAYTTVLAIDAGKYYNFTDCASLFDEYRFIRGKLMYHASNPNVTNTNFGVAAVDYSISTAFGSFDAANAHDTAQRGMFNNLVAYDVGKARFKWNIELDPQPDQDWIPTTTTGTVVAYWKPFIAASYITSSEDTGLLLGWMDFQFRGIAG